MRSSVMPKEASSEMVGAQRGLTAAFLVALTLHAGALAALAFWPAREVESPPGEQEITIDLAPAMEFADSQSPAEASMPEVVSEAPEVRPPDPVIAETLPPEQIQEMNSVQLEEAIESVSVAEIPPTEASPIAEADVALAQPPPEELVVAKPLEEEHPPAKLPVQKKAERKASVPRRAAEQRAAPSVPRDGQRSSSAENTGGAAAAADPNVLNRYAAQLASALRQRLRYPESARLQGISGVATIRFTMQRSGRITGASLVRGTGHAVLDQAALATAAPGTSLPPAPNTIPQQQFTFSVPLRFNLR
ncbi:TonB family protein [Microvirga brassicacearum]|uniref:Energy transducer TonB n=1 Tax=Microvirga brassicacearum TaxID=2580413 RepID=A0A5N3P6X1_9HYPH|nr:TonB family protein [Microvirga brassicacearum]KAB0265477.1 energy transducer TonB [Microvirga brassicacearum]